MIGNSDDEANFPHKLLLTNRQVANIRRAFANHTSTDIKLSNAQLTKMQKEGFLGFSAPLLKSGLSLFIGYARSNCCCISNRCCNKQKRNLGSGGHTTLIISNDDMHDLLQIVKSLEYSGFLLDGITETVKNQVKKQKGVFFINAFRYFRSFFVW